MAEKDKRLADSIARVVDTLPEREQGYLLGYAECLASQHEPCTPTGEQREGTSKSPARRGTDDERVRTTWTNRVFST